MSDVAFTFKKMSSTTSCVTGMVNGEASILEISSTDDSGLKVIKVDSCAFKGNKNIEEVIIPDSVKSIGESAFENCSNLRRLTLPDSMEQIGAHAFKKCDILSLILPKMRVLDFAVFSKNKNGIFAINKKIDYVKSHAFNGCKKLVCLLSDRDTKKWDEDWLAGAQNFSDAVEDLPINARKKTVLNENDQANIKELNEHVDDVKNKQELFDQNIETNSANGIVYAKAIKLSFPVRHLRIKKIPVLQSAQLSFYQKFIILLLEKGIKANDPDELTDSLSNILNVSRACVKDFVDYLINNSYLDYSDKNKKYKLCKEMHFTIKPELNNAMFAELDTKLAECNKIIYIKDANKCFLEEDFNNGVFRRKSGAINQNDDLNYCDVEAIKSQSDYIKQLLSKYFEKTNMHIRNDFSFDVSSEKTDDYQFEFDALLQYSYSKEEKQSTLFNVAVLKDNFLPKDFIDGLTKDYKVDNELPRFLAMQEQFYEKITKGTSEMDNTESSIIVANEKVTPLEEDLENSKAVFNELKKTNKQKKKEAVDAVDEVKNQIKEKENEISINESLINKSSVDDANLISNLKKTIKNLKKAKEKLETELTSKTNDVEKLERNLKTSEENLYKTIVEKEEAVSAAKTVVRNYEQDLKERGNDLALLLSKNKNKTNETIKKVVQKYPAEKNIFNRYVTHIVVCLDEAISASECNAVDEIASCIDTIREKYRKVFQIVFDTLLRKKEMSLGSYMSSSFNQIELEKLFKARNVNIDVKQRFATFHDIANAIGHLAENGPKKGLNDKRLNEFKKMSSIERNRILLAIPDFFNSITFTGKEMDEFNSRLTIK